MREASLIWHVSSLSLLCPDPSITLFLSPQFHGSSFDETLTVCLTIPKHLLGVLCMAFAPATLGP